jgi:hypothetical protein
MRVKSAVTSPCDGDVVRAGTRMTVRGWAWSGEGAIVRVEVAAGVAGDAAWRDTRLTTPDAAPHAWTRWEAEIDAPAPGRYAIRSRARDAAGNVQPEAVPWNRLGYGNNAVRPVIVDVA